MLAIETSEIGGTLVALSVPGLKPLFDKLFLRSESGTNISSTFHSGTLGSPTNNLYKANGTGDLGWSIRGGREKGQVSKDDEDSGDNEDSGSTDVILRGVHYAVEEYDADDIPLKETSVDSRPR